MLKKGILRLFLITLDLSDICLRTSIRLSPTCTIITCLIAKSTAVAVDSAISTSIIPKAEYSLNLSSPVYSLIFFISLLAILFKFFFYVIVTAVRHFSPTP